MKIGVYLDDVDPAMGGANSLVRTILNELKEYRNEEIDFEFYTWRKKSSVSEYDIDGFHFINLRKKMPFRFVVKRFLNSKYGFCIPNNDLDKFLEKHGVDILWVTTPTYLDTEYPYIFTVWDLGHRTVPFFPEVSMNGEMKNRERMYQKMLPAASYILIGNETGKNEIIENYSCEKNKIRIAPFPISFFCFGEETKPVFIDETKPFFFYPAQFWAHKNHIRIIKATKNLKIKYPDIKVYLTGSDQGNKNYIIDKINEYGLQDNVIITGFLSYPEMKYMYTHAKAMVFASLMGPNNLPPIEATYLGCPVIITDIEGHKEQLKDSAIYFNGYNVDDLTQKMDLVLSDKGFNDKMKESSELLGREFSEIKYCKPVLEIFKEFKTIRECWK